VVICLERGVDLHIAQLMPLPLTVSCFSKIQIGFTFPVPAYPGSPGKRPLKRVYVASVWCVSGDSAIRYVFLVLWMTSYFCIMRCVRLLVTTAAEPGCIGARVRCTRAKSTVLETLDCLIPVDFRPPFLPYRTSCLLASSEICVCGPILCVSPVCVGLGS